MDSQVLDTIELIVNKFYAKFSFGFLEADDMKQQIRLFALEALERFSEDNGAPLEHFLTVHVRNRLINFRRDKYCRSQKPCYTCPFYDPKFKLSKSGCAEFDDKSLCDKYAKWDLRNTKKKNLMGASPKGCDFQDRHPDFLSSIEQRELLDIIKAKIPLAMRGDLLRLLQGCKVPKGKRDKLYGVIKEIMEGLDVEP